MNDHDALSTLRAASGPLVVELWAPWCMPCRAMAPALDRVAAEFAGRVELLRVNADEQPQALHALDVMAVPTLIVWRGGREVARRTGALPESGLRRLFQTALGDPLPTPAGPRRADRILRLAAGAALAGFGVAAASVILLALAGVVLFSAVYDRCPVWRALSARIGAGLRRARPLEAGDPD